MITTLSILQHVLNPVLSTLEIVCLWKSKFEGSYQVLKEVRTCLKFAKWQSLKFSICVCVFLSKQSTQEHVVQ